MRNQAPKILIRVGLRCHAGAPRAAREALSGILGTGPVSDDAVLVASELVTNAVEHSGCAATDEITLDAARDGDSLRIAVHDPARTTSAPHLREHDAERIGGHGLRIVAQLARRWGVENDDGGRRVWAELPLSA